MTRWAVTLRRAATSGTVASVTSSVALGLLARAEGKGAFQPVNATSHWLNGRAAANCKNADLAHTGTGYVTHHAATVFWAVMFERLIGGQRRPAALPVLTWAVATSAAAAVIDYTVTPPRFTPGWEFVLSKRAMAVAYAAMAAGLAAGVLLTPGPRR